MKDFRNVRRIILNCPSCYVRGPHSHRMTLSPIHGPDCHHVVCENCKQETLFTKQTFDGISDKIQEA